MCAVIWGSTCDDFVDEDGSDQNQQKGEAACNTSLSGCFCDAVAASKWMRSDGTRDWTQRMAEGEGDGGSEWAHLTGESQSLSVSDPHGNHRQQIPAPFPPLEPSIRKAE